MEGQREDFDIIWITSANSPSSFRNLLLIDFLLHDLDRKCSDGHENYIKGQALLDSQLRCVFLNLGERDLGGNNSGDCGMFQHDAGASAQCRREQDVSVGYELHAVSCATIQSPQGLRLLRGSVVLIPSVIACSKRRRVRASIQWAKYLQVKGKIRQLAGRGGSPGWDLWT